MKQNELATHSSNTLDRLAEIRMNPGDGYRDKACLRQSELLADSVSKGFDVNVTTKHGVVMLSGSLANNDAIDHVKDIASKVDGVKSVDTSGLTTKST